MKIFRGVCVFILAIAIVSCDAPRINPLDPESPDYKYSTIEGTVLAQSSQLPMEGVKVSWKNQNAVVYTNTAGKFVINRIDRINGWIYFEKDNYSKDSTKLVIGTSKNITANKTLNALPKLTEIKLFTSIVNYYPTGQYDTLTVLTKVTDAENDIDSVMVRNKNISLNEKMIFNSATQYYTKKYDLAKLKISSLDQLIGTTFEIVAIDKNKKEFSVGSSGVERVINQQILCRSPLNRQVVTSPLTLIWERFEPGFNFTYMTQIYKDDTSELVWQKSNIAQSDVKIVPEVKLSSGVYYWVVWCVDEFQNKSRSNPVTFIIP